MCFKTLPSATPSPFILVAPHAGNEWPAELPPPDFPSGWQDNHIAYDYGTAPLTRSLATTLKCGALVGTYTRLLVDLNRTEGDETLITASSDGLLLATNAALPPKERQERISSYYRPFHDELNARIDDKGGPAILIALHSFTPKLRAHSEKRPWDIGVLYHKQNEIAEYALDFLRAIPDLRVGENQPYDLRTTSWDPIVCTAETRKIEYLEIEINTDQFGDMNAGVLKWTNLLADILRRYTPKA